MVKHSTVLFLILSISLGSLSAKAAGFANLPNCEQAAAIKTLQTLDASITPVKQNEAAITTAANGSKTRCSRVGNWFACDSLKDSGAVGSKFKSMKEQLPTIQNNLKIAAMAMDKLQYTSCKDTLTNLADKLGKDATQAMSGATSSCKCH